MLLLVFNRGNWREWLLHSGTSLNRIESLAVLPLENLSHDPAQEYFVDGMTETLIADLSRISALRVISPTSVMQCTGTRKPLPQIPRELKVDAPWDNLRSDPRFPELLRRIGFPSQPIQ